jgi:hypothetical protein
MKIGQLPENESDTPSKLAAYVICALSGIFGGSDIAYTEVRCKKELFAAGRLTAKIIITRCGTGNSQVVLILACGDRSEVVYVDGG